MKTNAIRILAALLAAALPSVALAQATPAPKAAGAKPGSLDGDGDVVSDNLRLHTVQRKPFSDSGLHEFVLYPAIVQLNPKFTSHMGAGLQYLYHLHENFALQAQGTYFYINEQTAFQEQLIGDASLAAQAASSLTLQWAATGGFEVTPIYGKFSFYEGSMANFSLVLTGGVGAGGTRIQLKPGGTSEPTFGETGVKFVGQVGAGFRVRLDNDFVIRLQVNDLVYTARVDDINGCTLADVEAGCAGFDDEGDKHIATQLLGDISSDVLNNVGVYAGVAYTF